MNDVVSPTTRLPRALTAKRAALTPAAPTGQPAPPPAVQVQPAPQPTPVQQVSPAPQNPAPQNPAPQSPAPAELDLTQFIAAEPEPAAPAAPAPGQPAPADPSAPAWLTAPQDPAPAAAAATPASDDLARLRGQVEAYEQVMRAGGVAPTAQQSDAASNAQSLINLQPEDLTPEELATYQGSIPVMEKVLARMLQQHVNPALQTLAADTQAAAQQATQVATTSFDSTLAVAVPDLETLARDPRFRAFVSQPIPYTGGRETVQSRLNAAYKTQDAGTIASIMGEFRTGVNSVAPPQPSLDAFQAPPTAASAPPVPRTPAPATQAPMLKFSERQKASADYTKGRITREHLDQINQVYEKAFAEQRVVMDQ